MATYRTNPHIAKPTPAHALTDAAESARQSVRDLPPQRVVREGGTVKLTRKPLTRAEVVAAYVHPAPEMEAQQVDTEVLYMRYGGAIYLFYLKADQRGADFKVTYSRGTTPPRWRVPADTPVDPADYHGDVVDSVVVWARKAFHGGDDSWRWVRVRAEWHDGRIHEVTVNGQKSTLKAALEALA